MPGHDELFEMRATTVAPLNGHSLLRLLFPGEIQLGRAHGSRPSERLAFLIHGLAMNEDYFGLLAPELIRHGYDVWAIRLPGYAASGQPATLRDLHLSSSLALYGWVVASAMRYVADTLDPRPSHVLAWGHSLGAATLATAVATHIGSEWSGPDRLVFEAPAFAEAIAFSGSIVAGFSAIPSALLDRLGQAFLMDDLRSSEFALRQGSPLVPGRTSRAVFNLNVIALTHPLACTPHLSSELLEKSWFVIGAMDRLVDAERLSGLLDERRVAPGRRLVLQRNHLLSLTAASEMVEWIER